MVWQEYLKFISLCALAVAILWYFGRSLDWAEVGLFYQKLGQDSNHIWLCKLVGDTPGASLLLSNKYNLKYKQHDRLKIESVANTINVPCAAL